VRIRLRFRPTGFLPTTAAINISPEPEDSCRRGPAQEKRSALIRQMEIRNDSAAAKEAG
jgi:hypothetical protein